MAAMLAGTAVAGVDLLNGSFMLFYFASCLSGHDNIAIISQPAMLDRCTVLCFPYAS